MKPMVFLVVLNALLLTCLSTEPPLKTQQIPKKRGYALHTPAGLEKTSYPVGSLPKAPVSLYKLPYNSINNYFTASNVIPQNNDVKNFYDEDEKLVRLNWVYDSLAEKLNKELVRKNKPPISNYELDDRKNPNFISTRRTELDNPTIKYETNGETYELNEDDRKHYKKNLYLMSDPELSNVETKSLKQIKSESSEDYKNLEPLNIDEFSVRRNEPNNLMDQNYFSEDLSHFPFGVTDPDLHNEEHHVPHVDDSLNSFTFRQPAFSLLNPIKGLINKIKPPMHNHMKFETDLTHYSLKHLLMPQNYNNELQLIETYLTELMRGDNYNNPIIIQILHDANELDLSKLHLINQSQLVKLSETDLKHLKRYFGLILNKYGLTPYTLKLLEYINLIEGKPKNETYLIFKILTNQQAVNNLSPVELSQIKQLLLQILIEYGQSPFTLPFIQNIKGNDIDPINNNNVLFLNVNNLATSDYVSQEDMRQIYLYLLQSYKNNPFVLEIIQNINKVYENPNLEMVIPVFDISSYQSLAYLNQNDLELLVKYILQIIKQRGENWYLNRLLFYINQIRGSLNKGINVTLVYDNQKIFQENLKELDLTKLYKLLLQLNNTKGLNQEILEILRPLINKRPNGDEAQRPVNLSADDLDKIKNILLQIKDKNEVNPIFIDIPQLLNQKDTGNPIFVKILQYINQNKDNVLNSNNTISITLNDIDKILANEINLDEIYKFILNEYATDNLNPLLTDIIIKYIDNNKNVKKAEPKLNVLSYATGDSLDRIKKFLLTLIKEQGEIPYVIQILQDINKVQGIPESKNNQHLLLINDKVTKVNEDDLQILSKYLTKIISEAGESPDVLKILKYVFEAQEKIKAEKKSQNKLNPIDLYISQIINNRDISPDVVDILKYINSNNWNNHLKKLDNLKEDDLNVLSKYLQEIITKFEASARIKEISDYINKIKEKAKHKNDKQNQRHIKITGENLNMINKHLLDLLKRYGMNSNVLQILYEINHITDEPNKEINIFKLITNSNKNDAVMKFEDFEVLNSYLLQLINKYGANSHLIKILGDINQVYGGSINVINTSILKVNNTHTVAIVDPNDINRIKTNLLELLNYYGLKPYIMKILNNMNSNDNNPNVYTFIRLHKNDLKQLTKLLLQLMEKHGAIPKFVEILKFIYQINDGINNPKKPENTKEQYTLDITKEINILLEHGVMQLIQNIDRNNLNTLYKYILQNIFISPNTLKNTDLPSILTRLIVSYKQEVSPVNKYILLKLYEFILKNGGVPFETFWQPGFINVLLDLNDQEQNIDRPFTINEESNKKIFVIRPYDYTQDIKLALKKLIQKMNQLNANNLNEESKNLLTNYIIYEMSASESNNIIKDPTNTKDWSCVAADRKFTIILKLLNNMFHLNEHKIDLTMRDLEKIFDIFIIFMKKLSLEKYGQNMAMGALIQELQSRLLQQQCQQHPNIAQELISRLVGNLQGIVSYLKRNNYSNDKITDIIVSLVETVLPDLSSITVKDCKSRTTKTLIDSLYSTIYLHEPQANEIQFVSGQVAQGNSAKDFLQTLSMQELLKEIARYKNLYNSANLF